MAQIINTFNFKPEKRNYRWTFTEDVLGSSPANGEIYSDFIGSKAPDATTLEDEVAALGAEDVAEKGTTIFPKLADGTPFVYDYQVRGFFKGACGDLRRIAKSKSAKVKAYKKIIDGNVFVEPRCIPIKGFDAVERCERPLRAQTAQGERVALASSESIPAGAYIDFTVECLNPDDFDVVEEWLSYSAYKGLGQWRNSGKGRGTVERMD